MEKERSKRNKMEKNKEFVRRIEIIALSLFHLRILHDLLLVMVHLL